MPSPSRKNVIAERIEELNALLNQWEDYRLTARDPSEQLRSEKEIEKIKQYRKDYEKELEGSGNKVEEDKSDPIIAPTVRRINRQWMIGVTISVLLLMILFFAYQRLTAVTPDYSTYLEYIKKGDNLIAETKFGAAREAYEKALEYNPKDSLVKKKIGLLDKADDLIKANKNEEAKRTFSLILNIPPASGLTAYASQRAKRSSSQNDGKEESVKPVEGTSGNTLRISLSWEGDQLIISIQGGQPFGEEKQSPYLLSGINCKDCVEWKKMDEGYTATVPADAVSVLEITVRDSAGNTSKKMVDRNSSLVNNQDVEPVPQIDDGISKEGQFKGFVEEADEAFDKKNYQKAKDSYVKALALSPNDAHCKKRLETCNAELLKMQEAAAKDIGRRPVSAGTFNMGINGGFAIEGPKHEVAVSRFSLSTTEVTVGQYKDFCRFTGRQMPPTPPWGWNDTHPIVNVTWAEAKAFCEWVGGRLPTEAEWEYAATEGMGDAGSSYSGGSLNLVAYYKENSSGKTHTVGSKKANKFGLFDMTGNASEWCQDWYDGRYYKNSPKSNPQGPASGTRKVIRGGSYDSDPNSEQDGNQLKTTYRNYKDPNTRAPYLGFRVAW
ncbi:MAG: SUMF1/EgtB/PvdO family nonheme iron enzyme [Lewinellaceae bacterium]|nr:SUMF1/EgtB/PvdO family nonheme iron enzyme [Lewinellaceae bacterium]